MMNVCRWLSVAFAIAILFQGVGVVSVDAAEQRGYLQDSREAFQESRPARPVRKSRLSGLIKKKYQLYLPGRLYIGQDNRFVIKGKPGANVTLFISPQSRGLTGPNGQDMGVGTDNEKVSGPIPDTGVLQLVLPVPNEDYLVGRELYVDGLMWEGTMEEPTGFLVLQKMDSTGRVALSNRLVIAEPADGSGALILPSMPGVPTNLLQNLSNVADITDERKKDLVDHGEMDREVLYDQNSFINRPGQASPGSGGFGY
ncbi:MAG: hypothetical protein KTR14_00575 [Vampirovibrio sp.]|nr:hypothetical protein [Vampirovibrio sp.]